MFYEFQVQTYSNNKINVFCIIIFSYTSVRISVTNSFFYYFVVFQSSAEYVPFLETLFRDLCVSCKYSTLIVVLLLMVWFLLFVLKVGFIKRVDKG